MTEFCTLVTSALLVGVIGLLAAWHRRWLQTFQRLGIPGPKPQAIIGNLSLFKNKEGFMPVLKRLRAEFGDVFGLFVGQTEMMVVFDLDAARDVLAKNHTAFLNRSMFQPLNHKPYDHSLLLLRDDHWKHVRSHLSPTFSTGKLKKMVPGIDRVVKNLINHIDVLAREERSVELKMLCGNFSMDVIAGTAFGAHANTLENPDDPFNKHGIDAVRKNAWLHNVDFIPGLVRLFRLFGVVAPSQSVNTFFLGVVKSALEDRRQDQQNKRKYADFLQLLVDAEKEGEEEKQAVDVEIDHTDQLTTSTQWNRKGLTEDEIFGNAMLFLLAGYDTVSTVMSFTLFSLAANPHCCQRAQEEVDTVVGKDGQVTYVKANELVYLDMCINESMRQYSPGFVLVRQCGKDVELAGGYRVSKGTRVLVPASLIHMDPDLWPDPDTFDPERHTPEARADRHPCAFLPFGLGPRNCIGMRLAQVEIRLALAGILQRYTPVLCEKSVNPPVVNIVTRVEARDGLWVQFQTRD